ncbi:SAM (And some other nucleotide) binding motif [hydrothermal vent metagenome]|uniref:SAM (And some other nucleotide) binding motif n=1 Tax=hydrothermal vent metagenome TaxID=652676 RepID=A0A3B1BX39_9ZZZZ
MQKSRSDLLIEIEKYYSSKLTQHGASPQGVDWNSKESQTLRFEQLNKIINTDKHFSINDLGCGYGAFYSFLKCIHNTFSYYGIDISSDMIQAANQQNHSNSNSNTNFIASYKPDKIADYSIASGIFNVRGEQSDKDWHNHIEATLEILNNYSKHGFAFNCLTSYSDKDKIKDTLYYANPCEIFTLCKQNYANNVALLHDYRLYEFTILVRKFP